jgi:uncharacterized membrane protein YgdD (TMEM256/DUF423 family)
MHDSETDVGLPLMAPRLALTLAASLLLVAVAAGAFGAHALKATLSPEAQAVYQTAVQYQFWHALGLLGVAILLTLRPANGSLAVAAWLLVTGTLLFSGSLYLLAITGMRGLGAVTPFGGLAWIGAWAMLIRAAWRW